MKKPPEPLPGQALCEACRRTPLFWAGNGRRPKRCEECAENPVRRKPGTKLVPLMEKRSHKAELEAQRSSATRKAMASLSVFAVRRMAVGLGLTGKDANPLDAAKAGDVKVDDGTPDGRLPTPEEAAELAAIASTDEYTALREGRQVAVAQLLTLYEAKAAISLVEHEHALSPAVRAQSFPVVHKAIQAMGGGKLAWPRVEVNTTITIVKE